MYVLLNFNSISCDQAFSVNKFMFRRIGKFTVRTVSPLCTWIVLLNSILTREMSFN